MVEAESFFNDLGVKIVTGQLYLGGVVMIKKALKSMWMKESKHVCNVYKNLISQQESKPQVVHVALTK